MKQQLSKLEIMTTEEAASYLRVAPKTVRRLVAAEAIPCIKVTGRLFRFRKATLDAWLEQKER